jgi:hypothetical protein
MKDKERGNGMDDVAVYYAGQACGMIPFASLPSFRLFCQESGFSFQWEPKQKRIFLAPGLKGKVCVLAYGSRGVSAATDFHSHERDVLALTERFLTDAGVSVVLSPNRLGFPEQQDLYVQFTVEKADVGVQPRMTIFQDESRRNQALVRCLETELKGASLPCASEWRDDVQPLHPFVEVRCQLPTNVAQTEWQEWVERIAFYLASGILRYLLAEQQISPLSCLSPAALRMLAATPPIFAEKEGERREMSGAGEARDDEEAVRLPERGELAAEVFFDYTVLRSDIEGKPFLIFGNLYVKNTGTEALINPVVCLRVDPPGSVKLGGQILPANLVETLGVQNSAGVKGWRFLEEDWFEQAMERGEYWMAPIQPVRIAPKESHPFQNFQITVLTPESGNSVTIEGFVFFREQDVQFASNNRIAVSC